MTSQIDPTVPVTGTPTTASVRQNFATAQVEITNLQNAVAKGTQITIADAPPANPSPGVFWFDSVGLQTYLFFDDGSSRQWVPAINPGVGIPEAPTDGAVYARQSAGWVPQAQGNVGRNLLHNGLFNVQQRGLGPFTANTVFTADRWMMSFANGSMATQIIAEADATRTAIGDEAAKYSLSVNVVGSATAGSYAQIFQRIEDVRRLGGKTIVVSFWAGASVAMKLGVNLAQIFGTGGSPSAPVGVTSQAANITTSWARYSLTFAMPSTSGKTLGTNNDHYTQIAFTYSDTTGGNPVGVQTGVVSIWGIQLEIGTAATPIEKISYDDDLRHCMRFFQQTVTVSQRSTASAASQYSTGSVAFPPMRATPTQTLAAGGTIGNVSSRTLLVLSNNSARFEIISNASGDYYVLGEAYALTADL